MQPSSNRSNHVDNIADPQHTRCFVRRVHAKHHARALTPIRCQRAQWFATWFAREG